jgi:hypothetical protein
MTALRDIPTAALVGLTALAFSALYLVSDVIEALPGGHSVAQLGLTLIAEAPIPVFVIGLYLVQRPQIGRLGQSVPPPTPEVLAAAIRDLGFAGMGAALLGAHAVSGHRPAAYPG